MDQKQIVTVVSHTHWDRAWYVTFQEFRARLVRLVDRLMDLLETRPDYRVFTLDGQMAVLEDYLEVRPQRQAELERLCRQGRLRVGPWYVLADEFLVSPEALIRNLQLGFRLGESYGGVSKLGYVPDGFGHIAQLPQILQGFGIDSAFFWRGLGAEGERLGTEFIWKAPDGSAVTAIWMPWGYHNISNLGYPIHWGDTSQMEFDSELALRQIQKAIGQLEPMSHTHALLLMNGIDHEEAEPRIPAVLALANQQLSGVEFQHGTLDEHLALVRAQSKDLPEFCGEFRWGKYSEILQGVYATRIYLKQRNYQVETLLERYAEPLSALAWMLGADVPEGTADLLWTGWKWLLKNHPHDDIYGSGIDPVHHEMLYRFDQAEQIGEIIVRDSQRQIARQIDTTARPGIPMIVFNPLGQVRTEIASADIDFDFDDPLASRFQLVGGDGQLLPYQILSDQEVFWMETLKANRKRRVRVALPIHVPAIGLTTFYVQEPTPGAQISPAGSVWKIGEMGAENDYLSFSIQPDGGLNVVDKITGAVYAGLHHFEDVDDAGDEYTFSPCENSQVISTHGAAAQVRLAASGPNAVTYEISRRLMVPAGLSPDRTHRSEQLIPLPVVSRVTLNRAQPGIFIETEVDNQAKDHKLSAVFPTGLQVKQSFVDGSFGVLARDIDLPDSTGWVEDPTPLMHQRTFTDLHTGGRGLAVLNRGLPAVEVSRPQAGGRIDLVLLRCVGWLSRDDCIVRRVAAGPLAPTPAAQCPGRFHFEYAILPHAGGWENVLPLAHAYAAPLRIFRADTHEGLELKDMNITRDDPATVRPIPWPRRGSYPEQFSVVQTDAEQLVLSSVHRSRLGDGLIVRYYNASDQPVSAGIRLLRPLSEAWLVNLNEEPRRQLDLLDGKTIEIGLGGAEIVTLKFIFAK
jgi:mannosylglycerate hydrolase